MKKKVVVIEDDEFVRENIAEILEMEGFDVEVAPDGESGVNCINEYIPDLILCDISMNKLDGYGVLEKIQLNPRTYKMPFIFITARAEVADIKKGLSKGADGYITKPFTKDELLRVINLRINKYEDHKKDLETLRKSISYSLPHEFRTPLMGVLGFASIIREEIDIIEKDRILEYIDYIITSANRLSELTGNFLLFTSLQLKKSEPKQIEYFKSLELKNPLIIIRETGDELAKFNGRENDLEITSGGGCNYFTESSVCDPTGEYRNRISPEETRIPISEKYFTKLLKEIMGNAFKFSRKNEPVKVCHCTFDGYYHLKISNINHTTDKDQIPLNLPLIQFNRERFEQQGIGLGLAISYDLVTLTGGSLGFKMEKGNFTACIKYPVLNE